MKRNKVLLFLILIVLCFSSCELSYNKNKEKGDVWFVGYGADFSKLKVSSSHLRFTINDIVELGKAFRALSEKADVEYHEIYFIDDAVVSGINTNHTDWPVYQSVLESELQPDDNDIVIFAFSSHGKGTRKRELKYGDFSAFDENALLFYKHGTNSYDEVSFSKVYDFIDSFKGTKFILCDTCYSGSFIVGDGVTVNKDLYKQAPISLFFNKNISQSSSVWVLSSCTLVEQSTEPTDKEHGGFTYFVLQGLGWNESEQKLDNIKALKGKYLTAGSIADYVYKNGGKYTYEMVPQTPVFSGGSSDVILFEF